MASTAQIFGLYQRTRCFEWQFLSYTLRAENVTTAEIRQRGGFTAHFTKQNRQQIFVAIANP